MQITFKRYMLIVFHLFLYPIVVVGLLSCAHRDYIITPIHFIIHTSPSHVLSLHQ